MKIIAMADIYLSHISSTLAAYDFVTYGYDGVANTGDEAHIVSNSYGASGSDNGV